MGKKIVVKTEDLTKQYDKVTVVDRLNLEVAENEVFGLLGPNGAGKTTTILMLLGLTEPASGTAKIFGFDSTREPLKVKRLAGYLPEKVGFYDTLTARENLRFIAELNNIGYAESEPLIEQVLKSVGLGEVGDKTVNKFSRGMKQRLGIADVLVKKPKVAFLDEPTAGLDPEGINQIIDLIGNLPKMGTTVVFSSHRLYEVQRVCHSIGILSKGKMVVQGALDELGRDTLAEGRFRIEVETAEPSPQLVKVIKNIKGVRKVEAEGNMLHITTDADLRAEISKAVVQSGMALIQVKIQEFSLDDIYMKYFHEG
ncbi:MAG: ATP-binding cassette domain-containing protein [Dehalococcoidia bacterium]|nr:ATP-binding cassette domain-containing protein [Dehalococcoidia bacterium]